ncbi:MAG: hypothetical protein CSA84_05025 [Actinomycetales bacterium]|nr:MAG: hypothetical protein CSA84_05025 [Actinomycetales bacterium]
MMSKLRLSLALFRASWIRTIATIVGISATVSLVAAVFLVLDAFTTSADEQLDGVYSRFSTVVQSSSGAPIQDATLAELGAAGGVQEAVPVGQYEARMSDIPIALVSLPMSEQDAGKLGNIQGGALPVLMSDPLQERLNVSEGDTRDVVTPLGSLEIVVVGAPDGEGREQLNRATYVVAAASTLAEVRGFAELARPNMVLVNLEKSETDTELRQVVAAKGPVLELQDRTQARSALLAGLKSILQTLPLVAMVAALLSVVLVFALIRTSTITQLKSLTMLRSLGASSPQLMGLAFLSAFFYSSCGAALGILVSKPMATGLLQSIPVSVRNSSAQVLAIHYVPAVVIAVFLGVTIVGVASAWFALKPALDNSVVEQLRDDGQSRTPRMSVVLLILVGVAFGIAGIAIVVSRPRELWFLAILVIMVSWLAVSMVVVPMLLRMLDSVSRSWRPGWIGNSGGRQSAQLRASALVMSAVVAMMVSLAGAAENMRLSANPTVDGMERIDVMVQQVGVDDIPTLRTLTVATLEQLQQNDGVEDVKRVQMGYLSLRGSRVLLQGAEPDSELPVVLQGKADHGELRPGGAYISTQIAAEHHLGRGDTFELPTASGDALEIEVLGVVTSFLWPNGLVVLDVRDSERIWGSQTYSSYEVVAEDRLGVRQALLETDGQLSDHSTLVATGEVQAAAARKVIRDSASLYEALSMVALFAAIVIAGGALALDTVTRLREYGAVRAVGARNGFLAAMVISRAAVLVGAGTFVGWVFGIILQYYLAVTSASTQNMPITMHWTASPTLTAVGAGMFVLVIASVGSLWRVQRATAPSMLGAPDL